MARVLVKFLTGYSRYNKGETAGFDEAKANQLCGGKAPVAQLVGPVKQVTALTSEDIDLLESDRQELAQAGVNMAEQLASVERREEELAVGLSGLEERARNLAAREAELVRREIDLQAALDKPAVADPVKADDEPAAEPKAKAPGAPPKQGAKA